MSATYDPNSIIAGAAPLVHRPIVIESGAGALPRGTVLGQKVVGEASSAAKAGGNTGTGTLTLDAVNPVRLGAKVGVYQVRCIAAASNNGTFRVFDPEGFDIGEIVMAGGAGAFDNDIKFALADSGTDFIVGDGFDVTVAAGSGKWVKSVATAIDGSQDPQAVLAADVEAAEADAKAPAYFEGEFAAEKLTFGAGHTADTVNAAAIAKGRSIYIRKIGAVA